MDRFYRISLTSLTLLKEELLTCYKMTHIQDFYVGVFICDWLILSYIRLEA